MLEDFDFQAFTKYVNNLSLGDLTRYMGIHPPSPEADSSDEQMLMVMAYNNAVAGLVNDYNKKYSRRIPKDEVERKTVIDNITTIIKELGGLDIEQKIWDAVRLWAKRRH